MPKIVAQQRKFRHKPVFAQPENCHQGEQMGIERSVVLATNSAAEPTLASTWLAVAGILISDELVEWPADLFALTDVILERSEAYRFVFSPPNGLEWPPRRYPNWSQAVEGGGPAVERVGRGSAEPLLTFWVRSGTSSASALRCLSSTWQRDTIRGCARLC